MQLPWSHLRQLRHVVHFVHPGPVMAETELWMVLGASQKQGGISTARLSMLVCSRWTAAQNSLEIVSDGGESCQRRSRAQSLSLGCHRRLLTTVKIYIRVEAPLLEVLVRSCHLFELHGHIYERVPALNRKHVLCYLPDDTSSWIVVLVHPVRMRCRL